MEIRGAIYRFCNYQERSQYEVKARLFELGAHTDEVGNLIVDLIDAGLLNEERFACSYVRGKFSLKHWGRVKITQGLKSHRISDYLLKKALKQIDPNAYFSTALRIATKKWEALSGERIAAARKSKMYRFMLQKGYESSIIKELLDELAVKEPGK